MKGRSKYLGQTFGNWTVVDRIVDKHSSSQGTHSTFILHSEVNGFTNLMTLSDTEMTKLSKGKQISKTIEGKDFLYKKNINTARNAIKVF